MARVGRWTLRLLMGVGLFVGLVAGLLLLLTRSQPGQTFVLNRALSFLEGQVDGTLHAGSIRSSGLLGGFMLRDVMVTSRDGRRFTTADSVEVQYALRSFLGGEVVLQDVRLFGPDVILEPSPESDRWNVLDIFRIGDDAPDIPPAEAAPASRRIAIRTLEVVDGRVTVRVRTDPVPPGDAPDPSDGASLVPAIPVRDVPGLGPMLEVTFQDLDADIEDLILADPEGEGQRMHINRLSGLGEIFPDPLVLEELRGDLMVTGDSVILEADRFWLPGTEMAGRLALALGPELLDLEVDLEAPVLSLGDFRWVVPSLPDGSGTGRVVVRLAGGTTEVRATAVDLQSGRSRIRGEGGVTLAGRGEPALFEAVDLEVLPLGLELVEQFLGEPLPLTSEGLIRGRIRADGTLDALRVAGEATVTGTGRGPATVVAAGTLHLGEVPGATAFTFTVDPLDYALVGDVLPAFPLTGTGRIEGSVGGRYGQALTVEATVLHSAAGVASSRLTVEGIVRGRGEDLALDLDGVMAPLSLTALARDWPDLPVSGEITGTVAARGPVNALELDLDLDTPGGRLLALARVDATDLASGYGGELEVEGFDLARVLAGVPDSTVLTGRAEVEGQGTDPATLVASGRVELEASRVAGIPVESASATLRLGNGHLSIAAMEVRSPVALLSGAGSLALEPLEGPILRPGESPEDALWVAGTGGDLPSLPPLPLPGATDSVPTLRIEVQEADLEALRPWLMPGGTIAGDTLSPLDLEVLRLEGIDPDTLPTLQDLNLGGDVRGEVVLRGAVSAFRVDGELELSDVGYGATQMSEGRIIFSLRDPLTALSPLAARLQATDVRTVGRQFDSVVAFVGLVNGEGEAGARLTRTPPAPEEGGQDEPVDEEILLRTAFTLDEDGTLDARVDELLFASRDVVWALDGPARVQRDSLAIVVSDFHLRRPGADGVRIRAAGRLPVEGEADFSLTVNALDLERLTDLLQVELDVAGVVDLDARVTGTAAAPIIEAHLEAEGLRWANVPLEFVSAELDYADRRIRSSVFVQEDGREVLAATLGIPANLAFQEVQDRFPVEEIEGSIRIREFPAAVALSYLEVLEDVQGSLTGDVQLAGTIRSLSPSGRVTLVGGEATLEELGVRYTGVGLQATLEGEGVIRVEAEARAGGGVQVSGTLGVSDLTDPTFDLAIVTSGFQAASRRDLDARIGGTAQLTGSFRDPLVTGNLRVEQANLFLDEFVRAATVVDLTDPAFFDVVDTTFVTVRPVLEASQNPFLQNLRMDVGLTVERDVWLRSAEINVEIAGDLATLFNRPRKEIVLVGQLEAVRGSYNGFGRRFEIQEGIVEFAGNPGINPRLDIQAATRLRTTDELLNIIANLQGTLLAPRVTLASDSEPPLAESELASYLIFGRPSSFLSTGERSIVAGATGAGVSLGLGIVANQLGTAVAQGVGLDYFAITTAADADMLGLGAVRGSVAAAQFELGQYLADEVFVALVLRPLSGFGEGTQNQFSGARVEWRFTDSWTAEAFVEDRFSRGGMSGFRELGISAAKSMGLLIYRDWGY